MAKKVYITLNDDDPYDGPTVWTYSQVSKVETHANILHITREDINKQPSEHLVNWSLIRSVRIEDETA